MLWTSLVCLLCEKARDNRKQSKACLAKVNKFIKLYGGRCNKDRYFMVQSNSYVGIWQKVTVLVKTENKYFALFFFLIIL